MAERKADRGKSDLAGLKQVDAKQFQNPNIVAWPRLEQYVGSTLKQPNLTWPIEMRERCMLNFKSSVIDRLYNTANLDALVSAYEAYFQLDRDDVKHLKFLKSTLNEQGSSKVPRRKVPPYTPIPNRLYHVINNLLVMYIDTLLMILTSRKRYEPQESDFRLSGSVLQSM